MSQIIKVSDVDQLYKIVYRNGFIAREGNIVNVAKSSKIKKYEHKNPDTNLITIWGYVKSFNKGEIEFIPEEIVGSVINRLIDSLCFKQLQNVCTFAELRNFALYVIMKGKDVYDSCFINNNLIDEYPPAEQDLYSSIIG
jgi:hypothetical protein